MAGYIFDLDGTLISLPVDWEAAREKLRRITGSRFEFRPVFWDIEKITAERPELRDVMFRTVDEFELEAVPRARLNDGSLEVLSLLSGSNRMALVTLQGVKSCSRITESLGIAPYFERRFTREDSLDRTTQIESAMSALGLRRGETTFVGDRINDLNAAKKVGVRFVMIRAQDDRPDAERLYRDMGSFLEVLKRSL